MGKTKPNVQKEGSAYPEGGQDGLMVHEHILQGLPVSGLGHVAAILGLPAEELARRCGLSRSTYHRKIKRWGEKLGPVESDVLARHSALMDKAIEVFEGDEDAARAWLGAVQPGLGGAVPLDLARTSAGSREVEKLLTRIDFGVYA